VRYAKEDQNPTVNMIISYFNDGCVFNIDDEHDLKSSFEEIWEYQI
jgi:hypothetical protein